MLQPVAVHHIAYHQLVRHLGAADIEVAQPSLPRRLVVYGDIIGVDKFARHPDDVRELLRLQGAVGAIDDAVAVKGVKADLHPAVPVPADGKLRLVAVAVSRITGDDGTEHGLNAADALYRVAHLLLLETALLGVGDVPPHTAAAFSEGGTVGRDPRGRGSEDFFDPAERVGLFDLEDPHAENISHG